jgi:hypothetical protein
MTAMNIPPQQAFEMAMNDGTEYPAKEFVEAMMARH